MPVFSVLTIKNHPVHHFLKGSPSLFSTVFLQNDIFDVVYLTEEQDERSGEFNAKSLIKIGLATKGSFQK